MIITIPVNEADATSSSFADSEPNRNRGTTPLEAPTPASRRPPGSGSPAGPTTLGVVMSTTRLTQDTYDRLQAELEDLRTRGRIEIARAIEAARSLGDLSENGDYHAAKDTQGKMEARIRQLQVMLEDAEVVPGDVGTDGEVTTGAVV